MSKNKNTLQFSCQKCQQPVNFSVFELNQTHGVVSCEQCGKKYAFTDETLTRQLKKFEALCRQIHESAEILSNTAVGIDVGEHHVKVPYKLLLTRLSSKLDLKIGDQSVAISFWVEPLRDLPAA